MTGLKEDDFGVCDLHRHQSWHFVKQCLATANLACTRILTVGDQNSRYTWDRSVGG